MAAAPIRRQALFSGRSGQHAEVVAHENAAPQAGGVSLSRLPCWVIPRVVGGRQVEKNCGVETRLLWTESEESLAQKLIARLQKLN